MIDKDNERTEGTVARWKDITWKGKDHEITESMVVARWKDRKEPWKDRKYGS